MHPRRTYLKLYHFCVCIPDYLYPFSEEIEGQKVRWKAAYDHALARMNGKYGYGRPGLKLTAYRSLFHILGSLLFILFATLVSRDLFGSEIALYVLLGIAAFALIYQELFLQPRTLGQSRVHGLVDLFFWVVPFGIYLFIHVH